MIRLYNVGKKYPGGAVALEGIDLEIARGEFVFLTGASGAGKTTLLRLLLRQERPTTGQILVNSAGLTNSSFGTDHGKLPTSGAKELEHTTSKGYQILLAMPWGNLGTTVKKGADVGFSIGVDFPGTGAAKRSQGGGQLMWQGTKNNYATDSGWGAIKLA